MYLLSTSQELVFSKDKLYIKIKFQNTKNTVP